MLVSVFTNSLSAMIHTNKSWDTRIKQFHCNINDPYQLSITAIMHYDTKSPGSALMFGAQLCLRVFLILNSLTH